MPGHDLDAGVAGLSDGGGDRPAGANHAAARFVERLAEADDAQLRVARGDLRRGPPLVADAETAEHVGRLVEVRAAVLPEEQRAAFLDQGLAGGLGEPVPRRQRLGRPARIHRRRAVAGADDPRVIGRARPAVGRSVGLDQRHPPAVARQPKRAPCAEDPGADHHDRSFPHAFYALQYQRRRCSHASSA